MASVFPDTSVNNPDTGFAWADGDIWNDPDSGLTYSWYNPVWKTGGAGAANNFVLVAGDDMTGDLTLGTDKVTLDATTGFINCKGWATFGNGTLNNSKFLVLGSAGSALQIEDSTGTNTVQIQQDGSASFAGDLDAAAGIFNNGKAKVFVSSGDAGLYVYDATDTSTPTVIVNKDGSAVFAGQVTANQSFFSQPDDGYSGMYVYGDNTSEPQAFVVRPASNQNISAQINFDGSASFASGATNISSSGIVKVNRTVATNDCFEAQLNGTANVTIKADGSATFAGTPTNPGVGLNRSGSAYRQGAIDTYSTGYPSGTSSIFKMRSDEGGGGSVQFNIKANGDASCRGTFSPNGITFNLEADDDTKYTSTTDVDGNVTLVYNGETLDVKDRLQKADVALKALKVAAAAAADFAALKSAIATALADI